jgi:DNA-binding MurR/RpiR family transcriptional regulator
MMPTHMPSPFDFERLDATLPSLPRKQQDLGRALRESPEVFAFGTLRALEHAYSVSSVTVIRLAKRLGYDGYADLQAAVREAYFDRVGFRWPNEVEAARAQADDLVAATVARHRANLDAAFAGLDGQVLDAVANAVHNAGRVLVFGTGTAALVARLGARLLRHLGVHAEVIESAGIDGAIALHDVQSGDVVIGVGLWLQFTELVSVMTLAKRLGATTVALVGSQAPSVRAHADYVLLAPAQGVAHTFSVVASIAMMELLVARVAVDRRDVAEDIRQRLHDLYVEEELIAPAAGRKVTSK